MGSEGGEGFDGRDGIDGIAGRDGSEAIDYSHCVTVIANPWRAILIFPFSCLFCAIVRRAK